MPKASAGATFSIPIQIVDVGKWSVLCRYELDALLFVRIDYVQCPMIVTVKKWTPGPSRTSLRGERAVVSNSGLKRSLKMFRNHHKNTVINDQYLISA